MIERYLAELSQHLRVGPLVGGAILAEVRAHLEDAGDGRRSSASASPTALAARFNARPTTSAGDG